MAPPKHCGALAWQVKTRAAALEAARAREAGLPAPAPAFTPPQQPAVQAPAAAPVAQPPPQPTSAWNTFFPVPTQQEAAAFDPLQDALRKQAAAEAAAQQAAAAGT